MALNQRQLSFRVRCICRLPSSCKTCPVITDGIFIILKKFCGCRTNLTRRGPVTPSCCTCDESCGAKQKAKVCCQYKSKVLLEFWENSKVKVSALSEMWSSPTPSRKYWLWSLTVYIKKNQKTCELSYHFFHNFQVWYSTVSAAAFSK